MEPELKIKIEAALKERVTELLRKKDFLSILIKDEVFGSDPPTNSELDYKSLQVEIKYYEFDSPVYMITSFEWSLAMRLLNKPGSFFPHSYNEPSKYISGMIYKSEAKVTYDSETGNPGIEIIKLEFPSNPIYKIER